MGSLVFEKLTPETDILARYEGTGAFSKSHGFKKGDLVQAAVVGTYKLSCPFGVVHSTNAMILGRQCVVVKFGTNQPYFFSPKEELLLATTLGRLLYA